jgi:putative two-component system response regulator
MAIVDTFEAMTTTQFYRQKPFSIDEAARAVKGSFGKQFDPSLAEAFDKALPEMRKVRETYSDALGDMINLDFSPTRDAPPAGAEAPAKAAPAKVDVAAKAAAAVAAARARIRGKR